MALNPKSLLGQRLADKYTLESLLGLGGFGAVYRARQAPIDRVVAVKVNLHTHRSDLQARFVREARLQAELRHPGCVMLLDCGETDGLFYLVQEFVDGISLKGALASGPLAPGRAIDIVGQVLGALGEAHRHHIVHRDIKPGNVMLTRGAGEREEARVLDFGIAKLLVGDEDTENLTGTGMSLGTPAYMAPEQIRPGSIGPWTDIYAVGALLYRLVVGRPAFSGATIDVLTQQLNEPPPMLPTGLAALDGIIQTAMAKAPDARFQSAAEMRAALDAVDGARLVGPGSVQAVEAGRTLETPRLPATLLAGGPTLVTPEPASGLPPGASAELIEYETDAAVAQPLAAESAPIGHIPLPILIAIMLLLLGGIPLGIGYMTRAQPGTVALADAARPRADADHIGAGALDAATDSAAAPDAAAPDAQAAPVDASPKPDRRPPPTPPNAARLEARFGAQLDACRCDDARVTLRRLASAAPDRRAASTERYEAACVLLLPGSCASR